MGEMFESRRMEKTYLAVVEGVPREKEWTCELPLGPDPKNFGKMRVDNSEEGKEAETHFRVLMNTDLFTLIEASPLTGRTHQIRVHLAESGSPIVCDEIYGRVMKGYRLGLRAVRLAYKDTFTRRPISILAPTENFLKEFGFTLSKELQQEKWARRAFVPKEKKEAVPQHRPTKTDSAREVLADGHRPRPTKN